MDDEIYVYSVPLPIGIHEAVLTCFGGYTIYVNVMDDKARQYKSYCHALKHIRNHDFEKSGIEFIESEAHDEKN